MIHHNCTRLTINFNSKNCLVLCEKGTSFFELLFFSLHRTLFSFLSRLMHKFLFIRTEKARKIDFYFIFFSQTIIYSSIFRVESIASFPFWFKALKKNGSNGKMKFSFLFLVGSNFFFFFNFCLWFVVGIFVR